MVETVSCLPPFISLQTTFLTQKGRHMQKDAAKIERDLGIYEGERGDGKGRDVHTDTWKAADTNSQICKVQNTLERVVVRSPEEVGEMREGSTPLRPSRLASQEEMRRCLLRRPAMQHAMVASHCNV